jgi:hypothetical protein
VLANAGRMTTIAMLRGGIAQSVRNHVASLVFGLSPVRKAMADTLTELSIGYPNSPLTERGSHPHGGPAPGARAPVRDGETPVGAGHAPRFALFAAAGPGASALPARYGDLLEPAIREPFAADGIWLVRPDGYVALAAKGGGWAEADGYLARIAGT